jgi:hypothetical protein
MTAVLAKVNDENLLLSHRKAINERISIVHAP